MFWSKNKKNVYTCKPQFYYIKVGCKGVLVTRTCFRDELVIESTVKNYSIFLWLFGPFRQFYRVTDEDSISETAV